MLLPEVAGLYKKFKKEENKFTVRHEEDLETKKFIFPLNSPGDPKTALQTAVAQRTPFLCWLGPPALLFLPSTLSVLLHLSCFGKSPTLMTILRDLCIEWKCQILGSKTAYLYLVRNLIPQSHHYFNFKSLGKKKMQLNFSLEEGEMSQKWRWQ